MCANGASMSPLETNVSADSNLLLIAILLFAAANFIIMYNECSYRQYACDVCVVNETS